jgi:hypothetical protein
VLSEEEKKERRQRQADNMRRLQAIHAEQNQAKVTLYSKYYFVTRFVKG